MLDKNDLEDLIIDAQHLINEAIRLLELYVRETRDARAQAYIVDHLKIIAGRDHGFLANDLNLDNLLESLDEYEPEDEEE
jgi:hypothetical protein